MAAVISETLNSILDDVQPDQVSIIIESTPGREGTVRDRLQDKGLDYRSANVGRMTVFETVASPADVEAVAQMEGVERIDHNPTFSTQGACVEQSMEAEAESVNRIDLKEATDAMDVPAAWASAGTRGEGISIGMVDTGVDTTHDVFQDAEVHTNNQPASGEDHGTWIAGALVGSEVETRDGRGAVRGVAPDATLYSDGALTGGKADFIEIANGAGWCLDNGVDVMNLSLGGGHSQVMHNMVQELVNNGVRVISSAGNSGPARGTVTCPAHHAETIAVASVSLDGTPAGFSARGPGWTDAPNKPDIASYGGSSDDSRLITEMVLGPSANGTFSYLAGTSMASPLVAGTHALQLARSR